MSSGGNAVKIPVSLDLTSLNKLLNKLKQQLNKDFSEIAKIIEGSTKGIDENMDKSFNSMQKSSRKATDSVKNNFKTIEKSTNQTFKEVEKQVNNTSKSIKDDFKTSTDNASKSFKDLQIEAGKQLVQTGNHISQLGDKITSIGKGMTKLGAVMTASITAPIMLFTKKALDTTMEFEAQMSKVIAITGKSGEEASEILEQLSAKARELGKATSFTAKQAGEGLEYMMLAGWDVNTAMSSLEPVLRLAEAGAMDLGTASDLVTDSWSAMGKTLDDIGSSGEGLLKYLNVLTKASTKSNTTITQLLEAMVDIGPTMKTLNIPLEDMVASLGALANQGVKGTQSANALSTIFARLAKPTADIQKSFDELNISIFDSAGKFRGVEAVFSDLRVAFSKLTDEQKLYHATTIAGKHYLSEFQMLINAMGGDFQKLNSDVKDSDNALYKMSLTMKDNAKGNLERFQSALSELMLVVGEKLLPIINDFIVKFTEWINKIAEMDEDKLKGYMKFAGILALIGPVLATLGGATTLFGKSVKSIGRLVQSQGTKMIASATLTGTKMSASFGLVSQALTALSNPLIAIPLLLTGIVVGCKKVSESVNKHISDANATLKENLLGIEKSYESLIASSKDASLKIGNTDIKFFGGDKQLQKNLSATFTAVETFIEKGVGDINTIMSKMLSEIELIAPNMSIDDKTNFGNYFTELGNTMLKAEKLTEEQAKVLETRLNDILNIDLKFDFKIDEAKALVALEGIGERLNETLYRVVSKGGNWDILRDSKITRAINGISHELYDNIEQLNKLEAPAIFETLTSSFETAKLKGADAIEVVEGLGLALSQMDAKKGADIFDMFALKLGMTDENIHNFINNTLSYWDQIPKTAQDNMLAMLLEVDSITAQMETNFNTGYGQVLNQNAEFWGMMSGEFLKGKEDIQSALGDMSDNLMAWIGTLGNTDITPVVNWLSEMLSTMVSMGALTEEQANGLVYNINQAFNQLEGVDAEARVSLDTSTYEEKKEGVLAELNAMSDTPFTMETLMNIEDVETQNEIVMSIADDIARANPQMTVKASIDQAKPLLDEIIQKLNIIEANKNKQITITTTETTTKRTIFEKVGDAISNVFGRGIDTHINPIMPNIPTMRTNLNLDANMPNIANVMARAGGNIGNVPNFTNAIQNINSRKLQKATNQASSKPDNTPAIIETVLNLDGNVIARVISDKVDVRNGAKFTANQRRFAY